MFLMALTKRLHMYIMVYFNYKTACKIVNKNKLIRYNTMHIISGHFVDIIMKIIVYGIVTISQRGIIHQVILTVL